MAWKQLTDASMTVGYTGGWCLKYVQDAFGTDHPYPTAISAWDAEPNKHTDIPPLGITVPVYLSLGNVPAGHVAIRLSDGWVASATQPGDQPTPYYHKSLDDLIAVYGEYNGGATYLGWGEHVGSVQVVENIADTATADQVNQDYLDILERPVDSGGLQTYTTNGMTNDQVRADLLKSVEYQTLQQQKATAVAQPTPNPVTSPIHNPDPTPEPAVTPPIVPTPIALPPIPEPDTAPPVTLPTSSVPKSIYPIKQQSPLAKAFLELIRLALFALPGVMINIITNDPGAAFGYGAPVLAFLRAADTYFKANPDIKFNGLPF